MVSKCKFRTSRRWIRLRHTCFWVLKIRHGLDMSPYMLGKCQESSKKCLIWTCIMALALKCPCFIVSLNIFLFILVIAMWFSTGCCTLCLVFKMFSCAHTICKYLFIHFGCCSVQPSNDSAKVEKQLSEKEKATLKVVILPFYRLIYQCKWFMYNISKFIYQKQVLFSLKP